MHYTPSDISLSVSLDSKCEIWQRETSEMSQKSQETKPATLKTRVKTSCRKPLKYYFVKPWIILHVIFFLFCSVLVISKCYENGTCILKKIFIFLQRIIHKNYKIPMPFSKRPTLPTSQTQKCMEFFFFSECHFYWIWNFLSVFCFYLIAFVIL